MNELALFAGAGGGILGGKLLGWRTVCAVEWDAYAASVLVARQNDKTLPPFPVWDDVQTFDGRPWRGVVDVISGGFPCQDISVAGKGAGIDGERSGMWRHMARIIDEVRPRFAFVENSPALVSRGLARVLSDLTKMGYNARWGIIGADDAGAPHHRKRIWILAYATDDGTGWRKQQPQGGEEPRHVADAMPTGKRRQPREGKTKGDVIFDPNSPQCERDERAIRGIKKHANISKPSWWEAEPGMGRMAYGVAHRVDRLKCTGNGQVPAVAELAWRILNGR